MAIKVKHDMNAAPAAAAGVASGSARRSMETARLFASGSGGGRGGGTQGATAHPVAPMGAHAQLTHASAPAVSAHAPAYHDTIDDRLRLLDKQTDAFAERAQIQQGVSDESWKQREQQKRDWNDADAQARLKAVLDQQDLSPMPGVKTSFPSAPQPDGGIGDKVSLVGETPEVFNKLKSISPELVGMRDSMNDGGLLKPFDTAMTMVLNKIYGNDVVPLQGGQPGSRNVGAIFDSIYQGGSQPAAPAAQDELSGVYDGGGSIFGEQYGGTTDRSLEFLHAPDTESASVGGESVAWKDYASSVGGMINALLRIAQ